jgi:eukaryotic-like serine/threonine-protein kinase
MNGLGSVCINKFCRGWTRDGRYILFETLLGGQKSHLWALPTFGDKKPFSLFSTDFNEVRGQISPDTHWIAYVSDESGKAEVYVQPFPDVAGGKWQISTDGGDDPQWRADGRELFYDHKLMSLDIEAGSEFKYSAAKQLFQTNIQGFGIQGYRNNYAVSADGQRFLISSLAEKENSRPITVVVNWPALFKN